MALQIAEPIELQCGLALPNRLVKAAMAEAFAVDNRFPNSEACLTAYREWARGGWGMLITGMHCS